LGAQFNSLIQSEGDSMLRSIGKWIGIAIAIVVTVFSFQFISPVIAKAQDDLPFSREELKNLIREVLLEEGSGNQSGNSGEGECPQARDLGPWAPSRGAGEDFEITATRSSAGVVVGLWWPSGQTPWGVKEVTTFIPRGLSVTVIDGAGRGWDYEAVCDEDVQAQMEQHMADRTGDTNYHKFVSFVSIDELVQLGIVNVRFDRRSDQSSQSSNMSDSEEETEEAATSESDENVEESADVADTADCVTSEAWEDMGNHDIKGPAIVTIWTNQTNRGAKNDVSWEQDEVKVNVDDTNVWKFRHVAGTFYNVENCSAQGTLAKFESLDFPAKTWAQLNAVGITE